MAVEIDHVETFVTIAGVAASRAQPRRSTCHSPRSAAADCTCSSGSSAGRSSIGREAVRDGLEAVRALEGSDRGTVTIALVGTLASTDLTARLQRFRRMHPDVRLALHTALSREVSALVRRGDAVLGLRYFGDPDPDLVSLELYREPLAARRPIAAPAPEGRTRRCSPERHGSRSRCGRALPASRMPGCSKNASLRSAWVVPRSFLSTASPRRSGSSRPASAWA
jgi:DNA-binding transcriptional LysR family regulator